MGTSGNRAKRYDFAASRAETRRFGGFPGHRGSAATPQTRDVRRRGPAGLIVAAMLGLATGGCMTDYGPSVGATAAPEPSIASAATRTPTKQEKAILSRLLGNGLRDPGSAKWRFGPIPAIKDGTAFYCGRVNAKNAYGGYTGMSDFIAKLRISGGHIVGAELGAIDGQTLQTHGLVARQCAMHGITLAPRE